MARTPDTREFLWTDPFTGEEFKAVLNRVNKDDLDGGLACAREGCLLPEYPDDWTARIDDDTDYMDDLLSYWDVGVISMKNQQTGEYEESPYGEQEIVERINEFLGTGASRHEFDCTDEDVVQEMRNRKVAF